MINWVHETIVGFTFILPALFANTVPVFIGGIGPIDFNKKFIDGRPIFGKNKTIGGYISATLAGGAIGIAIFLYFSNFFVNYPLWLGFLQGFGAMFGDSTGSFIKRRINLKPGGPLPLVDQIGFVIFAFIFCIPFVGLNWLWLSITSLGTILLHVIANTFAYKMGWKDVWW